MTYTIPLNSRSSHTLEITEQTLETIRRYSLFSHLTDSNGYVDETVLDKLKWQIRSLIASQTDCKDLLDLCIDVIYHNKMKAYGLQQLMKVYETWKQENPKQEPEPGETPSQD